MSNELNSYKLSRIWFNFCFENPEKIKPNHTAMYFFAIEHCNRLGWKSKFGFPSTMVMEAIGIKSYNTYKKTLDELVLFGFFEMVEKSKNQYSANIIRLSNFNKALNKALDKAFIKHASKQDESIDSIDKQETKKQKTKNNYPDWFSNELKNVYIEFFKFRKEIKKGITESQEVRFWNKLKSLSNSNCKIAEKILIQSIENGWQGIFELKTNKKTNKNAITEDSICQNPELHPNRMDI